MTCNMFDRYLQGQIVKKEFQPHLNTCPECQREKSKDDSMMDLAISLHEPVHPSPRVWQNISAHIHPTKTASHSLALKWIGRIAAMLVLSLIAGFYYWPSGSIPVKGLLADQALQKVEIKEKEYLDAIAELEKQARPNLATMSPDLSSLYRERLRTIDSQINRCQEALAENRANAHIRRYLLAALHDKQETLEQIRLYAKS